MKAHQYFRLKRLLIVPDGETAAWRRYIDTAMQCKDICSEYIKLYSHYASFSCVIQFFMQGIDTTPVWKKNLHQLQSLPKIYNLEEMQWFEAIFKIFDRVVFEAVEVEGRSRMNFEITTSKKKSLKNCGCQTRKGKAVSLKLEAVQLEYCQIFWKCSLKSLHFFQGLTLGINLCLGQKLIQIYLPDMCGE